MISDMFSLLAVRSSWFGELLAQHIAISFLSIALAGIIGLSLGIAIAAWRRGARPVLALVNFVFTIPSIALFGFLIPVTGVGNVTAVVALTVYALLPMVRNTYTGIVNIDPRVIEAARGMGATERQLLYRVELPLAAPVIMSGIRNMATMTIALAGIASFIGAGGLGVAIYRGITTNNLAMTLAGSVLIAVLAIVVDALLGLVEKRLRRPFAAVEKARGPRRQRAGGAQGRGTHETPSRRVRSWSRRGVVVVGAVAVVVAFAAGATALVRGGSLRPEGERLPGGNAGDGPNSGALSKGDGSAGTIQVATKPMTEQYVLGEMLKTLVEHDTDLAVELTQGVGGGVANIQPALMKGDFDLYPEYTGTGWNEVLKHDDTYNESRFGELRSQYEDDLGLTWLGMYGFNNTYGLAVSSDVAERFNLSTYSDLAQVADQLKLGAEPDFFDRQDGYLGLSQAYDMSFGTTMDMDIGLKYQALFGGQVDAIVVFTTDGQLAEDGIVVLKDDRGFYPSYLCGNVVRLDTLEAHPELRTELEKLEGLISDDDMARMNHAVESEGREPKDVADEFLAERGLL